MNFSVIEFFSIANKLIENSLIENFTFCVVTVKQGQSPQMKWSATMRSNWQLMIVKLVVGITSINKKD